MDNEPGKDSAEPIVGARIRDLLGGAADVAELCMRCGFCNAACPTSSLPSAYLESRTSRGRAAFFRGLLSGRPPEDPLAEEVAADMEYCMSCGRCMNACPLEIPIPLLVGAYREARAREKGRSAAERLLRGYAALDRFAGAVPKLYNAAAGSVRGTIAKVLGFREDLELPRASDRRPRIRSWRDGDVLLLVDTYTWAHEPGAPEAVWRLLVAMGLRPEVLGPLDHGMVLLDLGYISRLREEGAELMERLSRAARGRKIVVVSPASYYMLRRIYPVLLGDGARRLSADVVDVYELVLERCRGRGNGGRSGARITYHESCLSRSNSQGDRIRKALGMAGYQAEGTLTRCCGLGGAWGLRRNGARISDELVREFLEEAEDVPDGSVVASESEACRFQLRRLLPRAEIIYPADLLRRALEDGSLDCSGRSGSAAIPQYAGKTRT